MTDAASFRHAFPAWTPSSPRPSTSSARSLPSSRSPRCCSPAARTPWSCCTWPPRRSGRARCPSRCCTWTPATTSPRSSTSATAPWSGWACKLVVGSVQEFIDSGELAERADGTRNPLQTVPLLDAIQRNKFDAVFGGGRRDEDKARAKERILSLRDEFGQWDPRNQRPELWNLYNGRHTVGQHVRAFPISNWTELDVWRYIERENIELPGLYYAHDREVFARDGMWRAVGEVSQPREHEEVLTKTVRYRTVGDMSCTGAVESAAATVRDVVIEVAASTITERGATRADDRISEAAMEDRKKDGYF